MPVFVTPEPITATLTTGGARVRITASPRPDTVVTVEPLNPADTNHVKVAEKTTVDLTDTELTIKTIKSGDKNGSVAITIDLPAGSDLVLNTAWTDVTADGPLGEVRLEMGSGQVHLAHVTALHGNLATGTVEAGRVTGTVDLQGGSADLRLGEVDGTIHYQGSTGHIHIGHAHADINLTGANGTFTIDHADANITAQAANCPIHIGHITRGQAHLTNASGGIDIGINHGTAAWIDAKSTKGTVHTTLPTQHNPDTFDNHVTIHARTRLDDILIHRATN